MRCARCDAELERNTAGGLCPVCLLDAAFFGGAAEEPGEFHYDLVEEIARGGMGVVYRAVQHGSQRQVAVKMILAEQAATPGMMERFRAEAEAVASLDHRNILPIYEIGESDGRPFYSMKFANGGTLRDHVTDYSRRPREAARLIALLARAVHHAHQRGILHRDLKPGNVLLDGAERTPYVSDFGLAKWIGRESRLTLAQSALGTPHYLAPEQAEGDSIKLTPAADIYSLGAILYELLTGRPPFVADTPLETLRLSRETESASPRSLNAAVPRDLEVICRKCLAKEPTMRYPSAVALAEDLERWLEGHTILARPATPIERAWRWTKRNRALAALSGALVLALFAMAIAWIFFERQSQPLVNATEAPEKSIAILPLLDLSPTKDQEYFCDGISEQILDSLAKVEGLHVVARTSSFSFKGTKLGVKEIAQKLGVRNLLEGSLRRDGDRLRVTVQLINARDGFHLWSETYERQLDDVFTVQDEITRAITNALKLKLVTEAPMQERNSEAYDLYLQGLFFSNKSTEEGLRKSLELFQRSLEKDPNSAKTWVGIAKAWNWLADAYVKPSEAYPQLKAAALKALELDEREAGGHLWLAEAKRVLDWDVPGTYAELTRALELDPNSAIAHSQMAFAEIGRGNNEEAAEHTLAALKLDPLSPIISNGAAIRYLCSGEWDKAIAESKRTLELDPSFLYMMSTLAAAYREKGMFTEAIALYQKAQLTLGHPDSGLAVTYVRMGREDEARQILNELKGVAETKYVPREQIAVIYAALNEKDEAFKWLDRACEEHSGNIHTVAIRPDFQPLHSDPRFAALLRRIGLDPDKLLKKQP